MFGYLIQVSETKSTWCTYLKVILAVETGYSLDVIKTNVFKDELKSIIHELVEGSKIRFSGYTVTNSNGTFFRLDEIENVEFGVCNDCLAPVEDAQCQGCMNEPSERISGTWKVAQITQRDLSYKFIFTQNENILGYVSFPNSLFHNVFKDLGENDAVILEGWRNIYRHTKLKTMKRVNDDRM